MEVEPFLIAGAVTFVGAQRLMRKICRHCAVKYKPSPALLKELGIENRDQKELSFFKAGGCSICNNTGYTGRMAVMEALEVDNDIRELILEKAPSNKTREVAIARGMVPLKENALAKVLRGETTLEEFARVTGGL